MELACQKGTISAPEEEGSVRAGRARLSKDTKFHLDICFMSRDGIRAGGTGSCIQLLIPWLVERYCTWTTRRFFLSVASWFAMAILLASFAVGVKIIFFHHLPFFFLPTLSLNLWHSHVYWQIGKSPDVLWNVLILFCQALPAYHLSSIPLCPVELIRFIPVYFQIPAFYERPVLLACHFIVPPAILCNEAVKPLFEAICSTSANQMVAIQIWIRKWR